MSKELSSLFWNSVRFGLGGALLWFVFMQKGNPKTVLLHLLPYLIPAIVAITLLAYIVRRVTGKTRSHGSSQWLSYFEKRRLINPKKDGLVIDGVNRISMKDSFEHCAIFAPSGKGKTASFIIPNVMYLGDTDKYSGVVIDPSGEIFDKTAAGLQKIGYNVLLLKPGSEDTMFYNPLYYMETDKDCKMVAETLISKLESNQNPFWHLAASSLITTFLKYLVHMSSKADVRNFSNLIRLLALDYKQQEQLLDAAGNEDILHTYSGFKHASVEAKGGVQYVAKEAIQLFLEQDVINLTSRHNINFEDLRNKKTILYLVIPEGEIEHYNPLLRLFFRHLFNFLSQNVAGYPVFVFLEEFGNLGRIPNFESTITTIRKRNVSLSLVLQDPSQVENLYGKAGRAILDGGCGSKIYLPGLGHEVCERLSRLLGSQTMEIENESVSVGDGVRKSKTTSAFGRSLLTPDEIRTMEMNEAIFITGNKKPVKLITKRYYEQRRLKDFLKYCESHEAKLAFDNASVTEDILIPRSGGHNRQELQQRHRKDQIGLGL